MFCHYMNRHYDINCSKNENNIVELERCNLHLFLIVLPLPSGQAVLNIAFYFCILIATKFTTIYRKSLFFSSKPFRKLHTDCVVYYFKHS